jgi:hypothetical protein
VGPMGSRSWLITVGGILVSVPYFMGNLFLGRKSVAPSAGAFARSEARLS